MALVRPGLGRDVLHGKRHLRAGDVAEADEGGDEVRVPGDEAGPEPRQARALRQRLERDDIGEAPGLGTGRLERSRGRGVAIDLGIAFVGEEEKIETPRERDRLRKISAVGDRALRVRRRVEVEGGGALKKARVNDVEIRQEAVFGSRLEETPARRRRLPRPRHRPDRTGWGSAPRVPPDRGFRAFAGKIAENNPSRDPLSGSICCSASIAPFRIG